MKWPEVQLDEIAVLDRHGIAPERIRDGSLYVGLEHIGKRGDCVEPQTVAAGQLASNKFAFSNQHILYGKLRPYLGKIVAPDFQGICSTDIIPILPTERVDRRFLLYCLTQERMVEQVNARSSGANLPRISPKKLGRLQIPLPPLSEQKRIARILDQADALRAKRRETIKQLDALVQSVFLDMFGDPVTNPKGWEVLHLESLCERITDGTHQSPEWASEGVPFLFVSNIRNRRIDFESEKHISEKEYLQLTARCPIEPGDVLYTTVGSYGNPALVREEHPRFAFQRHIAHIKPKKTDIDPRFLEIFLDSPVGRKQADRYVRGVAQKTLNLRELKKFIVMRPPMQLQQDFVHTIDILEQQIKRLRAHAVQAESLFTSLQSRAFKGEL